MSKCAVVTGAASGIGAAVAKALSEQGHNVVVADMNETLGNEVANKIGGVYVHSDLSQREACEQLIDTASERFGGVDILVNNAGFQHVSPVEDFPEHIWDLMMSVMLTAPFLLTRYAWPHMKKQGWGRVVNIASIHSVVASINKVGYISAKHGMIGLTKTTALEGGDCGITVNALSPSYVRTPLVENQIAAQAKANNIPEDEVVDKILLKNAAIKKLIEPEEVAALVNFLCSDNGATITGANWTMDCGWTAQ